MLLVLLGIVLVVVAAADVFTTTLNYDGFRFLTSRGQRYGWVVLRALGRRLPNRSGAATLAVAGPLLLPVSVGAWTGTAILGFALIYQTGLESGAIALDAGLDRGFAEALYVSGVTITTLGYGDITPTGGWYQLAAVLQALMGFSILTLAISYLSSTFGVLGSLSRLAGTLRASDADRRRPETGLRRYFLDGEPRELSALLQQVLRELRDYREGLRRYPIAYYFHPRDVTRSVPFAVAAVADMTAALRFCTDDREVADEPWLRDLADELDHTMQELTERFLPRGSAEAGPAGPGTVEGLADVPGAVARFREKEAWMAELLGVAAPDDLDHDRFAAWYESASRRDAVVSAVAADLGYGTDELPMAQVAPSLDAM